MQGTTSHLAAAVWFPTAAGPPEAVAYRRVVLIAIVGLLVTVYTIFQGQDPLWMEVELGIQALVMLGLLHSVTRPELRAQFAGSAPGSRARP